MEIALFTNKKNKRENYKEASWDGYTRQNIKIDLLNNVISNIEDIRFPQYKVLLQFAQLCV